MRNIFVDWGTTKPHTVLIGEQEPRVEKLSDASLFSLSPFNAFLEAGCPHFFLYTLIQNNCEIYLCDTKAIIPLRQKELKTDESDVQLIRQLWLMSPSAFHKLSVPERKDMQIRSVMGQYVHLMTDHVRFKNRETAYQKEFGQSEVYKETVAILDKGKKEALRKVRPLLTDELKKVDDIQGLGLRFLAGLLAVAHPKRFPTLSKFLSYCGYKSSSWQGGRGNYNRMAKTIAWQMSKSVIMHKDKRFYPLYLQLKKDLSIRFPEYRKVKLDGMARNRLSTFLLKELYARFMEGN